VRLRLPGARRTAPQLLATAGLLAVAVVVGMLLQRQHVTRVPAAALSTRTTPSPTATPLPSVPAEDLAAAHLSGAAALVTPFQQLANDGSGKTLIGAYADPTRTVLFFRSKAIQPVNAFADISAYDSHGFLNGSTSGGRGIPGDSIFALDLGPRPDADGLAHITVTDTFPQEPFTAAPPTTGWAFRFVLKIQPMLALPAPARFPLRSWQVKIENLGVTPSVIDFQAVVAGANNQQLFGPTQSQPVELLDSAGNVVSPITSTAGVTVPKQQLNAVTYQNTRVHLQWARPPTATSYTLRISANGATQTIILQIPPL
jgi:hypothetical protein